MTNPYGRLYGIGVGPGDPELLTLKAIRILASVHTVFAARSSKNTYSTALNIVAPHLPRTDVVRPLDFPMTRDSAELEQAWDTNARIVHDCLARGNTAAFLTLGDPMTYSTFGYLSRTLLAMTPDLDIRAVPGITSYQAAAAESMTVLAEQEETLAVVSGALGGEHIRTVADCVDSLVVLKSYKCFDDIKSALAQSNRTHNSVFASKVGHPEGACIQPLEQVQDKPGYFSLVLAPPKRSGE